MEEEFKSGLMGLDTMVFGEMVWQMVMDVLYTLREMSMKENGPRIRPTDLEFTPIIMEVDMRVSGSKINNMVMV